MFRSPTPPPASYHPGGLPTPRVTALGGFATCAALPLAALAFMPLYGLTARPMFELLAASTPSILFAYVGQWIWLVVATLGIFFAAKALLENVFSALGARLKFGLLNLGRARR